MKKPPETSFLNQCRRFANQVLSLAGVEIVRRPRRKISGTVTIQVGKYPIFIPASSALWVAYFNNPEYSDELGRLATQIFHDHPGGLMIDVGANVGDTAAIVKSAVDVPVVCIEGDPVVLPLLRQNIAPMKDVTVCPCFLGDKTEDVEVVIEKQGWNSTIIPVKAGASSTGKKLSLVTLDDIVTRLGPSQPCKLLKVDVEGFDLKVLRGASNLLRKDRPVILFEWNHQNLEQIGESSLGIFSYLAALEYEDVFVFDGNGQFILPCKSRDFDLLRHLYDYAMNVPGLFYYDICIFHKQDVGAAERFISAEQARRKKSLENRP